MGKPRGGTGGTEEDVNRPVAALSARGVLGHGVSRNRVGDRPVGERSPRSRLQFAIRHRNAWKKQFQGDIIDGDGLTGAGSVEKIIGRFDLESEARYAISVVYDYALKCPAAIDKLGRRD